MRSISVFQSLTIAERIRRHITTPFGGFKESGFGGRDKSIWAHEQYTELKTIWMQLA